MDLNEFEVSDKFIDSINQYYDEHMDTFGDFIELSLCDKRNVVQLIYIEEKPRDLEEQQDYEYLICEKKKSQ